MSDPFQLAAKQLGMNERDQNAALSEYLANGGVNLDPAVTAWCAAYVNATLAQSGMKGTGSNLARSFETWGVGVDQPQRGDLAVFWRESPDSGKGHVGFFDGYNADGTIRVLGGNQGDSVSYSSYSPDQLLGFRRAPGATESAAVGNPNTTGTQNMGGAAQSGQNALAGMAAPGQNALAGMAQQQPQFQWADMRQDPAMFMVANRRNALAM